MNKRKNIVDKKVRLDDKAKFFMIELNSFNLFSFPRNYCKRNLYHP